MTVYSPKGRWLAYFTYLVHDGWLVGELVATHRKMHLFDIDIPGQITFKVDKQDLLCMEAEFAARKARS